jgi:hypothetical protein
MSKKSKSAERQKRRDLKRARRAANAARYAALRDAGKNQKSKRFQLGERRVKPIRVVKHRLGRCFNIGCKRCNP